MIKLTPLIKPVITPLPEYSNKKLVSLSSHNEIFGELSLNTRKNDDNINSFVTELKNKCGKILGKEIFSIEKDKMFGFNILVEPEYRKKSFHLGELLRLSSIIEMIENKAQKLDIYSKETAVYFHSKYKFEPDITSFIRRDYALQSIIQNRAAGYEDCVQKAQELFKKCKLNPSPEDSRQLCKDTNKLVKEYINRVLSGEKGEYIYHPFNFGMDMTLPQKAVIDNKDYFNSLFVKHGIDYEI